MDHAGTQHDTAGPTPISKLFSKTLPIVGDEKEKEKGKEEKENEMKRKGNESHTENPLTNPTTTAQSKQTKIVYLTDNLNQYLYISARS